MKRKNLLLFAPLLAQVAPAWAMVEENERGNFSIQGQVQHEQNIHDNETVSLLKTQGTQRVLDYCENETNNHQGSIGDLSTKLKYTDGPAVQYEPTTHFLSLTGTIVRTSDIHNALIVHPNPVRINVFGLHTLFVDADITVHGTSCNFIAPHWKIGSAKTINLSGEDHSTKAAIGPALGSDGAPGAPGGNGRCFYGKGVSFEDLNQLTINTSGGKGGKGGDGAKGITGYSSLNGSAEAMVLQSTVAHVELQDHTYMSNVPVQGSKCTYESGGAKGGTGGTGGKGGAGGQGGLSGGAFIDGTHQSYTLINSKGDNGTKGNSGPGGDGGRGGDLWRSILISDLKGSYGREYCSGPPWMGRGGRDGNGNLNLTNKIHVTETVIKPVRWEVAAQKVGDGFQGDKGEQPDNILVSPVAPVDPTLQLCLDASGNLTSDYKSTRLQEYKNFRTLQSIDPVVSPFVNLFPGI